MDIEKVREVGKLLASPKKIVITAHKAPDGDAIGSSLGLAHYLRTQGHEVGIVVPDAYPHFLKWMPGNKEILKFNRHWTPAKKMFREADIIFLLDYNALNRIGEMGVHLQRSEAVKVMIDHHQQPEDWPEFVFSDTSACSTCQLVYEFIDGLEDTDKISADAATCLYCGIMTDTGSFRFPSTTSKTHRIVADLIDKGANNSFIHEKVLDANTFMRLKMVGYALGEKMTVYPDFNTVIIALDAEELERFEFKKGDTEGLVNYGLSIEGIRLAAFVSEKEGVVKISFRSKGDFSVNQMAREHFNGGGHINAAGGASDVSVVETVKRIEAILPQYKEALTS